MKRFDKDISTNTTATPADQEGRMPYEKPMVISDKVFETLALSCGSVGAPCDFVPPKS